MTLDFLKIIGEKKFGRQKKTNLNYFMKKKILILGASGMLGSMVYNVLKEKHSLVLGIRKAEEKELLETAYGPVQNHRFCEFDFNLIYQDYLKGFKDLATSISFKKFIDDIGQIDYVINCAGIIIPHSLKDPANTMFINSALPHLLSSVYKERMIHVTTDCIYNGLEGFPYDENSDANSTDLYGLSKWLGEPKDCLTLRTSIVGPEISGFLSLLEWFKNQNGQTIKGFTKHFWNGVTTKQFAIICDKIIENRNDFPQNGLFHIFSNTVSKYEMLLKFQEKYKIDCKIIPDDSKGINRTLATIYPVCSKLQVPSFDEMLGNL